MTIGHHESAIRAPHGLAESTGELLTTPFEDWCEASGIHPEAFGAWEQFTHQVRAS